MNLFLTADAVRVDSDEKGFALIIDTDEGDKVYVNIHACGLEFYDSVRVEMRGWVHEADLARAAVASGVSLEEFTGDADKHASAYVLDAYELDDPKHPTYHERMVD